MTEAQQVEAQIKAYVARVSQMLEEEVYDEGDLGHEMEKLEVPSYKELCDSEHVAVNYLVDFLNQFNHISRLATQVTVQKIQVKILIQEIVKSMGYEDKTLKNNLHFYVSQLIDLERACKEKLASTDTVVQTLRSVQRTLGVPNIPAQNVR